MEKIRFITPAVTIFTEDGKVNLEENRKLYDFLIKNGMDGILVMGSSGEFYAMPYEERKKLVDIAVETVNGRAECIIGTGSDRKEEVVELSNYSLQQGADAVMIIGPHYFFMTPDNLKSYFDDILPKIKGNVYLYNYPDRTGYDLSLDVVQYLLVNHQNLIGYKDTVSDFGHTRLLISSLKARYPNFQIYSGFDENLAHIALCGGDGCIGGISNLYPKLCAKWTADINEKNWENIKSRQKVINTLMGLYSVTNPFIPAVKYAMKSESIISNDKCLEFNRITDDEKIKLRRLLQLNL